MAEYIDRTQLETDTEWSEYYDDFISYSKSQINSLPTADVVERKKIDKAIEEIKAESYREHIDGADCDDILIVELRDVLEILDKLIAESEE